MRCLTKLSDMTMGVQRGSNGEQRLPLHLVKILTFCVTILTFGQHYNICSPLKKIPVDTHGLEKFICTKIDDDEKLPICGDMNRHERTEVEGFEGVHGWYRFGKRNVEGEMILEFADALNFCCCKHIVQEKRGKVNHI